MKYFINNLTFKKKYVYTFLPGINDYKSNVSLRRTPTTNYIIKVTELI